MAVHANNYTVTGPSPGYISGLGNAPWTFGNDSVDINGSNLGFGVSPPSGNNGSTISSSNGGSTTINIYNGASVGSDIFGEPSFNNVFNGIMNITLSNGSTICPTGGCNSTNSNDLIQSAAQPNSSSGYVNLTMNDTSTSGGNINILSNSGATITLNGSGNIVAPGSIGVRFGGGANATVNFNSTGTIVGLLQVSSPSSSTYAVNVGPSGTANVTLGGTVSGMNVFDIYSGSTMTTGGAISGVNSSLTVAGTLNLNHTFAGSGNLNNSGIININIDNPLSMSGGTISNSGTFNIYHAFNPSTFTANTGIINVYNGGTLTGNLSGTSSATLNIGEGGSQVSFSTGGTISMPFINVITSSSTTPTTFTASNAITLPNSGNSLSIQSGTTATFNAALNGPGSVVNSGTMIIGSGGSIASTVPTITLETGGLLEFQTSSSLTNTNIVGDTSTTSTELYVTNSSTLQTTKNITNIATVLVDSGSTLQLNSGAVVSGVSSITGLGTITNAGTVTAPSGTTTTIGATTTDTIFTNTGTISGAGTLDNYGTVNLNSGSSVSIANLNANTNGIYNVNTNLTLSGTAIGADSGSSSTTLAVNNGVALSTNSAISGLTNLNIISSSSPSSLTTTSTISGISAITLTGASSGNTATLKTSSGITNISTLTLNPFSVLELQQNGYISSLSQFVFNGGTLKIDVGGTYTLSGSDNISSGGGGSAGNSLIDNYGNLVLDGSNVVFPGGFINEGSGIFTIESSPTLEFEGTQFSNLGTMIANFSSTNSLPHIVTSASGSNLKLSSGMISINYNNNYIAGGNYPFITAGSTPTPSVFTLPQPGFYVSFSEYISGNTLGVTVTRTGFNEHALTYEAQEVGAFLEQIGAEGATGAELTLLNALEQIQNDEELTIILESLLPPQYTMLVTMQLLDTIDGALDIRLANIHSGYGSGDQIMSDQLSAWARPFYSNGNQNQQKTLVPFNYTSQGWVFGMDRNINANLTLGILASVAKTKVIDTTVPSSITNINTYLAGFYGTFKSVNDTYLDVLLNGGTNNYHGTRNVIMPTYTQTAFANYSCQQFTLKFKGSKSFALYELWQLTPNAMAQYSFLRQLPYTETGAGPFDVYNDPENTNLFRLGAGANLGIPFATGSFISIPGIYFDAYYDTIGGADTTNCQFVSGGPILTNTVQLGKLMLRYGASYQLKYGENLEMTVEYDRVWRRGFSGHEAMLNLRYIF